MPGSPGTTSRRSAAAPASLIEITARMAIIAILVLAIVPQLSKYFERAAVQNLSSDVANTTLTADSDYSHQQNKILLARRFHEGRGVRCV